MAPPSATVAQTPAPSGAREPSNGHANGKPLVSLVLPAYNESAIVQKSLGILCRYLQGLEEKYHWEIILVNDGSRDATGRLAEEFAATHPQVKVLHHPTNFGMGQALISGFRHSRADYVITLDLDLSFAPEHIARLLEQIRQTRAKIVIASPFLPGGGLANVPFMRKLMTIVANRLLARASRLGLSSITGVGRAYDGRFIRALDLRSTGMDINPEILYKAKLLNARMSEIPATLDWQFQLSEGPARKSNMRIQRHVISVLLSSFFFRPVHFFMLPGTVLLLFAFYVNAWSVIHWWNEFQKLGQYTWVLDRSSAAIEAAYRAHPHTFVVGGIAVVLSVQLLSLGVLSLQNKKYFEELFHLGTTLLQNQNERDDARKES